VQRYLRPLLERIMNGDIDPSSIITHRIGIDSVPAAYKLFRDKEDQCIKVVITF
jgi:threonine dehydrogenase-like Zn-dependent dehydrogenase